MFWTIVMFPKFLIMLLFAAAGMWYSDHLGQPYHWTVPATYMMTGIILLLIGLMVDIWNKGQQPQKVKILLRHQNQFWYLMVMQTKNGETFAPADPALRKLERIEGFNAWSIPDTILGCPKFTPLIAEGQHLNGFKVLGKVYTV